MLKWMGRTTLTSAPADAIAGNWVDRRAPGFAKPYLRLMRADRPIGTWLLLIPCWWGVALAGAATATPIDRMTWHAILLAVGAVAMRGAGCAYNDIIDRDYDARVARTASRPIPSGQIGLAQAWAFLVALSLVGLVVLLQFNTLAIALGLASLLLVAAYPFAKRVTWWPQAWLGLAFNWGVLLGYGAATGDLSASAAFLYCAGIFWTLGYDTIYAHQDKEDDALVGVKSSARRLGDKTRPALIVFYAAAIVLFIAAGLMIDASLVYFAALIPAACHFAWQITALHIHDPGSCLRIFRSNRDAGLLLLAPLLLEALSRVEYVWGSPPGNLHG